MTNIIEGKVAKKVYYGKDGECLRESKDGIVLRYANEFHGDYDMDWIIVFFHEHEIARINCKYIESIEWEATDAKTK